MLWQAGQERMTREQRTAMAQLFFAMRDAGLHVQQAMGVQFRPSLRLPAYVEPDRPALLRTTASRDRALAMLGMQFPGMVKGRPS